MKPKKTSRRRCVECRGWYRPEPSASKTQKTCGAKCRQRRRGKYEKKRRASDAAAAREGERERQRRHRERVAAGASRSMSQAGLSAEAADAIEEIVKKLGQAQRLSQADLRRQLREFSLGETARAGLKTGT